MDKQGVIKALKDNDNFTIITHKSPDGDTLGCGFAVCAYLRSIGKHANVVNNDEIPKRYGFLCDWYSPQEFDEQFVIAVDIADVNLMGDNLKKYQQPDAVDLCIDHHISNTGYAKETYVDATAGAAAMIIYEILSEENAIDQPIASMLYTGIATDTGCFKFQNTNSRAHYYAAKLIEAGADFYHINRQMFEVKSKNVVAAERAITSNMKYFCSERVAVNVISLSVLQKYGVDLSQIEAISSFPLTIEGVCAGVTLKEKATGVYKISLRTTEELNASVICNAFGGGGHIRAAGCEMKGELYEVIEKLINKISEYL
ncbi:MAG: bifunctional oligoribonuclease/PAP phosphatase NrnA [Ruminococcus sp.]|nr:bifunctional oligoribonuclease/PAP phosphatase NrnA [Ruminococcus sp.]